MGTKDNGTWVFRLRAGWVAVSFRSRFGVAAAWRCTFGRWSGS
jgi:hypothetical protein